jgi:hypothetical protein
VYRLKVVPEIICYDGTHLPLMIIFGLIPMFAYLIYIPFKTAKALRDNEQRISLNLQEVPSLQRLRSATQTLRLSYEGILSLGYVSTWEDKIKKTEKQFTIMEEIKRVGDDAHDGQWVLNKKDE